VIWATDTSKNDGAYLKIYEDGNCYLEVRKKTDDEEDMLWDLD